jgi:hypothetical protein
VRFIKDSREQNARAGSLLHALGATNGTKKNSLLFGNGLSFQKCVHCYKVLGMDEVDWARHDKKFYSRLKFLK